MTAYINEDWSQNYFCLTHKDKHRYVIHIHSSSQLPCRLRLQLGNDKHHWCDREFAAIHATLTQLEKSHLLAKYIPSPAAYIPITGRKMIDIPRLPPSRRTTTTPCWKKRTTSATGAAGSGCQKQRWLNAKMVRRCSAILAEQKFYVCNCRRAGSVCRQRRRRRE